jgi:hypothetical protein
MSSLDNAIALTPVVRWLQGGGVTHPSRSVQGATHQGSPSSGFDGGKSLPAGWWHSAKLPAFLRKQLGDPVSALKPTPIFDLLKQELCFSSKR